MHRFWLVILLLAAAPASAFAQGIQATQAWARASPVAGGTVGVFMTLHDSGPADRLTSATADAAGMAVMHESVKDGTVARMRPVQAIALPAGGTVQLKPGGLHIMLMDLNRTLRPGDTFPIVLTFDNGPPLTVPVTVLPPGSAGPTP